MARQYIIYIRYIFSFSVFIRLITGPLALTRLHLSASVLALMVVSFKLIRPFPKDKRLGAEKATAAVGFCGL